MSHPPASDLLCRRDLLRHLGAAGLSLPLLAGCAGGYDKLPSPRRPGSRLDGLVARIDPTLDITNGNTGERLALTFAKAGRTNRRALHKLAWMFRDWRENKDPDIDERLYWGLAAISNEAKRRNLSGHVTLLSGYRTRKTNDMLRVSGTNAASNSFHIRRRAMDIRVDGMEVEEVADYARWLEVGGVGRYDASNFVHVDSGDLRTWAA